jgi:uncharacterized membrane protein YsdA (DUF1294 family)
MHNVVLIYLVLMNLIGLYFMYQDKRRSIKRKWRIPEINFFIVSVLGGSLGSWAGMYLFHHKTKHTSFVLGIPFIFILQILFIAFIIKRML